MSDILLPLITALLFLAAIGYTAGCERLNAKSNPHGVSK